ncbi:MAG: cytochrome c [Paenibacillaceae bacterium]|uniref:c-type cytochrome n=1 Tax=Paenibacillus cymbidii TaxID=1639034 RepID=UPI0010809314|nr:cytochrome c [Paenibacillus cymbidii]MBO9609892.1 cytochrome c [Paenibacillaceae bacterium]
MWKKGIATIGAAALMISLAACGGGSGNKEESGASPGASAAPVFANAEVETLYKTNCLSCHGDTLGGKIGPSLKKIGGKLTADKIAAKIENGAGTMPAFKNKLKDTEITALADWLATKK